METVYDVLRIVLQGLARVGGITEEDRTAAHAVINEADPGTAEREAAEAAAPLSDAEAAELARLQERQAAAKAAQAEPEPADVTAPPVATPGAGFAQGA